MMMILMMIRIKLEKIGNCFSNEQNWDIRSVEGGTYDHLIMKKGKVSLLFLVQMAKLSFFVAKLSFFVAK